jgi:hypothetical protein
MKKMKKLNEYSKSVEALKENMISEIKIFFAENPEIKEIDVEKVYGSTVVMGGEKYVDKITSEGVKSDFVDDDQLSYDILDLCDIEFAIEIINMFIDEEN